MEEQQATFGNRHIIGSEFFLDLLIQLYAVIFH